MFHCSMPMGGASLGEWPAQFGINVCLRKVTPKNIFDNITQHKVTHMGGAPTVLNMIVNSKLTDRKPLNHKVVVMTGGSPPPPQILSKMEEIGFSVSQLYGLTETYGPGTFCAWRPEWDTLPLEERSKLKARQGVPHVGLEEIDVKDPATMESVPADGTTMGEVMFRGNTVMSGYLRDLKATEEAFKDGWFHSGDLGVKHSDGYIEIKDRLKDIIVSGGENISSVEDGFDANAQEIINFCRDHLPHYMAPKTVIFQDMPKTATGKIQKYALREKARPWAAFLDPKNVKFVVDCLIQLRE
ncbi:AMP-dependent synthetase/ligase [Sesbania bispinosa]|nr:AMP-dependent synthetase/ligase [Sesbania bispinosa]